MAPKSAKALATTGENSFLIKNNAAVNDWSIESLPPQDGDELLYVISGSVEVTSNASPNKLILGPNDSCIIPKGEWHNVHILEPAKLIHITPGPGGEHRPLA